MASRPVLTIALALALAAGSGCSKTQDTAPESRLFGQPPVIQTVNVTSGVEAIHCDFTPTAVWWLHDTLGLTVGEYQFQVGTTFEIDGQYSKTVVTSRITDPQDTATTSDILLVTSSYQVPSGATPEEISLLMFDDGSSNHLLYKQQFTYPEKCTIDPPNGIYDCQPQFTDYYLTSNDTTSADHVFTRAFGFTQAGANVAANGLTLLNDCVAIQEHQYPQVAPVVKNSQLQLKIEAVDHEGNLTAWPNQPSAAIVPSSLTTPSDDCMLCLLTSSDPASECRGAGKHPGVVITDPGNAQGWPTGPFCENLP